MLCLSIFAGFITYTYGSNNDPLCISVLGPNSPLTHKGNYQLYTKGSDIALVKIAGEEGKNAIFDVIKKEEIRRDENGFPVATFFGRDAHFLFGGNYVIFRFLDEEESGMIFLPATCRDLIIKGYEIYPSGIEVSSPSYLIEGAKRYTPSNLTKTFIGVLDDGGMLFNTMNLPWSEGEKGPGIGVTLSIHFLPGSPIADSLQASSLAYNGMSDVIVLMNGYVDFYRPDLFLKNNRLKTVLIKSTDNETYFEQEYELKDAPEFQVIQLPRKVRSVDMIIKEVYKGTRYDDTVITSISPLGKNLAHILGTLDQLYTKPYYVNWKELSIKTEMK